MAPDLWKYNELYQNNGNKLIKKKNCSSLSPSVILSKKYSTIQFPVMWRQSVEVCLLVCVISQTVCTGDLSSIHRDVWWESLPQIFYVFFWNKIDTTSRPKIFQISKVLDFIGKTIDLLFSEKFCGKNRKDKNLRQQRKLQVRCSEFGTV